MMLLRNVLVPILLIQPWCHVGATEFQMPFDTDTPFSGCSDAWRIGDTVGAPEYFWYYDNDPNLVKFHGGEDYNCGTSSVSDLNAPLEAIGAGRVVYLLRNDVNYGNRVDIRYNMPYAFDQDDDGAGEDIADNLVFDLVTEHMNTIDSGIEWVTGGGTVVTNETDIGTLGATGAADSPHLHIEMQDVSKNIRIGQNPWVKTLPPKHALKYLPPTLVVHDHAFDQVIDVNDGEWSLFTVTNPAPSSISYSTVNGVSRSLEKSIADRLLHGQVYVYSDSQWTPYTDLDHVIFVPGKTYAIWAFTPLTLHIVESDIDKEDKANRARRDMMRVAADIPDIVKVALTRDSENRLVRDYRFLPDYTSDLDMHMQAYVTDTDEIIWIYQVTNQANAYIRFTTYYDRALNQWSPWAQIESSRLY